MENGRRRYRKLEYDYGDEIFPVIGSASGDATGFEPSEADKKRWRKEVRDKEARRIVPGFYLGERPKHSQG